MYTIAIAVLFSIMAIANLKTHAAPGLSPLYLSDSPQDAIPGSYLVVMDPKYDRDMAIARLSNITTTISEQQSEDKDKSKTEKLHKEIKVGAMHFELNDEQLQQILEDDTVLYVQQDMMIKIDSTVQPVRRAYSWGLDRIDQPNLPLDKKPYTEANFVDASGVDVYIVDTGVNIDHEALKGRADHYYVDSILVNKSGNTDENGHGTHCAGIVAGRNTGASNARIKAVKVFGPNGRGSLRALFDGVSSIFDRTDRTRPAIASLSLGLPHTVSLINDLLEQLVRDGVTVVVAAGNEGVNACETSPSSAKSVISVGSVYLVSEKDTMSSTSNYGECVDILAPGIGIVSSYKGGPAQYGWSSGTSQAAPFVSGTIALYLARYPDATPAEVREMLLATSVKGKINENSLPSGTPNRIVQAHSVGKISRYQLATNHEPIITSDFIQPSINLQQNTPTRKPIQATPIQFSQLETVTASTTASILDTESTFGPIIWPRPTPVKWKTIMYNPLRTRATSTIDRTRQTLPTNAIDWVPIKGIGQRPN